ncbi:MAG TPA: hypothetical protein PLP05_02170 [Sedimentisphaerales bacterium]|nr:hypothetical protein [Sedimentisphaerales bacterium]
MRHNKYLMIVLLVAVSSVALGGGWTAGPTYLRLNQGVAGGHSDNYGVNVGYDWDLWDSGTFGVEGIGSWANDAEIYGAGANIKQTLYKCGDFSMYAGAYADYIYATELQKELPGLGQNEEGLMYGPLFGMKFDINDSTSLFAQYRYGWFDGGTIRRAFDEANMAMLGLEFKF